MVVKLLSRRFNVKPNFREKRKNASQTFLVQLAFLVVHHKTPILFEGRGFVLSPHIWSDLRDELPVKQGISNAL